MTKGEKREAVGIRAPRSVKNRLVRRPVPARAALDDLVEAIQTLLSVASKEDPLFLSHGLQLLLEHLHADQAYLVTVEGGRLITQWWLPEGPEDQAPRRVPALCHWLLENPARTLVLREVHKDKHWKDDPDLLAARVSAVAGAALHEKDVVRGLIFLNYRHAHEFTRAELALFGTVVSSLSRILEIETLKSALNDLENFLAITKAVVEDSSIQDTMTDLPNLRYLDIWLRVNLPPASREHEIMTVAEWILDPNASGGREKIQEVSDRIRGGDLLVSMGHGHFLLVLPRMPKGLGQIFLLRLRQKLGAVPMSATLWIPELDDIGLESVLRRLKPALEQSQIHPGHELVWSFPEDPDGRMPRS